MSKEKRLLFGTDGTEFAKQALFQIGNLLKESKNVRILLFHGSAEAQAAAGRPEQKGPAADAREIMDTAVETLQSSGFNPAFITPLIETDCPDPAGRMLRVAKSEQIETIAVARWGKTTISRQVLGSTTYRLSQLGGNFKLWVIDPRICSHDVLVTLVGAPISRRVVDYTEWYFAHLRNSKFTFFHVVPPVPPQCCGEEGVLQMEDQEQQQKLSWWLKDYTDRVKEIAGDAKRKLMEAGIPEQNVILKFRPQKAGTARDILVELEEGNHGILVVGRKGFKDIDDFGLGSKANKLLIYSRSFIVCLVD